MSLWTIAGTALLFAPLGATWNLERADAPSFLDDLTNGFVAVDSANRVHVVYGADRLYHQVIVSGVAGEPEIIDPGSGAGRHAAVVCDSSDHLHVSYFDETHGALRYATNASGAWAIQVVEGRAADDPRPTTGTCQEAGGTCEVTAHCPYHTALAPELTCGVGAPVCCVPSPMGVGRYTALAVDGLGAAHLAYSDVEDNSLRYATNSSGAWVTTLVNDPAAVAGKFASIAVGVDGIVHLVHVGHDVLSYVTNATGIFVSETVPVGALDENHAGDWPGPSPSVGVDAAGDVLVTAYSHGMHALAAARRTSAGWSVEFVDRATSFDYSGRAASMRVLPSGEAHAIFVTSEGGGALRHAVWPAGGGAWTVTSLLAGVRPDKTSFGQDSQGRLHVVAFEKDTGALSYVRETAEAGVVATAPLFQAQDVGVLNSLALDAQGRPHACTLDRPLGVLRYSFRDDAGAWHTEIADAGWGLGEYNAIAVGSDGRVHLSYFDAAHLALKVASRSTSGQWTSEVVDQDPEGVVGVDTSIAVDAEGHLHVTYLDYGKNALKHAEHDGAAWTVETVDPQMGTYTDLAIDAAGRLHVSYVDGRGYGDYDLRHAVRERDGQWQVETVINGNNPQHTSIAVDAAGGVHIAYEFYNAINYAYRAVGDASWALTCVQDSVARGFFPSLVTDGANAPHLTFAHIQGDRSSLWYATRATGEWRSQIAAAKGDVGYTSALAIDADGRLSATAYDRTNADLVFLQLLTTPTLVVERVQGAGELSTREGGGSIVLQVRLADQRPRSDVVVAVTSSNDGDLTASPATLLFTAAAFAQPQSVTLQPVDDSRADGSQAVTVTFAVSPAGTTDTSGYLDLPPVTRQVTVEDDDTAGLVFPAEQGRINEGSDSLPHTGTLKLATEPTGTVLVALASSDQTEGTVAPTLLTFTPVDWDRPQEFTVSAVDDEVHDGSVSFAIVGTVTEQSADLTYRALPPAELRVVCDDDEDVGVWLSSRSTSLWEKGDEARLTVRLASTPVNGVTVKLTPDAAGALLITPAQIVFPGGQPPGEVTVSVRPVDDELKNGNRVVQVAVEVDLTSDPDYAALARQSIEVTVVDDESQVIPIDPEPVDPKHESSDDQASSCGCSTRSGSPSPSSLLFLIAGLSAARSRVEARRRRCRQES
ncbi:MAG: hypothetical protein HY901_16875 [Deltaproteobacteria bacterium]|nr:hypothetical protein [Deltaproteobacteria bacterium]